jgi:predicted transposase YbfD/YdcC
MINQEWTILRNWQHWVHMTQDEDKQNKNHNTENYKDEQHGPHQVCV